MSLHTNDRLGDAFYYVYVATAVLVPLLYARETAFVAFYPKLMALQLCTAAMAFLWAMARPAYRRSSLVLPMTFFLVVTVLSVGQAVNRFEAVVRAGQVLTLGILFLAVLHNLDARPLRDWLRPIVVVCALVSTVGIFQYAGWAFLWVPSAGMPSATLGYRNFGAMFAVIGVPLAAGLLLGARSEREAALWTAALALIAAYLVATRTRAAWLGLFVAFILCAVLWVRVRRSLRSGHSLGARIAMVAGGLAVGILFSEVVPPGMGDEGYETHSTEKVSLAGTVASVVERGSDKGRLELWRNSLDMLTDHPFGVGAGNWQFAYPAYDEGDVTWQGSTPRRPHNDYVWVATELGLPGLAAAIWLLAAAARAAGGFFSSSPGDTPLAPSRTFALVGLTGSLTAILVHAFFSFPSERVAPSLFVATALGMLAVLAWQAQGGPRTRPGGIRLLPFLSSGALLVAALLTSRAMAFDAHFARASEAANRGVWSVAVDEASRALQEGVFDPQVYLIRGLGRSALGDHAGAVSDQEACLTYHPYLVNAYNNLALAQNGLERYDEALATADRLLELNPNHAEGYAQRGMALRGLKRFDKALEAFRQAEDRSPANLETRYQIGLTYELAGRLGGAAQAYASLVGQDSTHVSGHYRLGVVRLARGQYVEAVSAFARVLSLNPDYAPAYYSAGEAYAAHGDTALSIRSYNAFLAKWRGDSGPADLVRERIRKLGGTPR